MTQDAIKILERMVGDDSELLLEIALSDLAAEIAEQVYEARTARNLTQIELAELVGTSQSAVARVENADYDGHSIRTLVKIAFALNFRVKVNFAKEENERPIQINIASQLSQPSDATGTTYILKVDNGGTNEQITRKETDEARNPLAFIGQIQSSDSRIADSN